MRDVIVLAVIAVFFALCVAYVRWCDHIIGPDPDDLRDDDVDERDRRGQVDVAAAAGVTAVERNGHEVEAVRS